MTSQKRPGESRSVTIQTPSSLRWGEIRHFEFAELPGVVFGFFRLRMQADVAATGWHLAFDGGKFQIVDPQGDGIAAGGDAKDVFGRRIELQKVGRFPRNDGGYLPLSLRCKLALPTGSTSKT